MKKLYIALLLSAGHLLFNPASAQISLTTPNGTYSENFNGMGTSGTTLPTGWGAIRIGGSGVANAPLTPGVTDGSANSGNVYNVGATGDADRALGSLASGSTSPAFGASFTNNTGSVIGSLSFTGFSEQWRSASNSSIHEIVVFEYSTDATSLSTGTWTALPSNAVSLVEILTSSTSAGAVNGNTNRAAISGSINTINLAAGSTVWIRWRDADNTGSDGLYALDDFEMSWTNTAVANTASVAAGNNAAEPATNGSFTVTLNNAAPAGGITVNYTLSGTAIAGTDYTDAQNGSLTIAQGATSGTVTLTVNDDNLTEPTESVIITLNSVSGGYSIAGANASITLADNESSSLYSFDFASCTGATLSDGFTQQSVTGAQSWACTTFGRSGNGVQMNGFATTAQENDDWLISPVLDLTGTTFPLLSFASRSAFNGAPLQLYITTNFTGDVSTTTWTELGGLFPSTGSNVWTLSENINLSAFKQANVRIAFRYRSTTQAASRWTLDDINIVNSATPPAPSFTLKNGIVDFRYIEENEIAIGKPVTFRVNNPAGNLTVTAPENFLVSKNNFTYNRSVVFTEAELLAGERTVYVGFYPKSVNTIYSGLLSFAGTGINVQRILAKGNTYALPLTLNVVNWNVEWFGGPQEPTNDDLQQENARKVMNSINADVYALSEIVDTSRLGRLVRSLDSSYAYVVSDYASNAPDPNDPDYAGGQKLALVYKTTAITNVSARGLMKSSSTANSSWASGRVPFLVTTRVVKGGASRNISFVVIHAKAGDTQNDYQSRLNGAKELKDTLDQYFSNRTVMILGDFNDDLDQSIYTGGGPNLSSYDPIIKDSADADNYRSISLLLSQYGLNSTVSFSDVIDHAVVSNELFASYLPLSVSLYSDIEMLTDVADFGNTTSDHYPVLSRFFLTGTDIPLPVKLNSFSAKKQNEQVLLSWRTALEVNSSEFIVERSANGVQFAPIGTVAATGNSSEVKSYDLLDKRPLPAANFYRLVSVDVDGKKETSKTLRVDFGSRKVVSFFPNPATNYLIVTSAGNGAQLQIIDMTGKVVKTKVLVNAVETIAVQSLMRGTYLVRVVDNENTFTEKLVIK